MDAVPVSNITSNNRIEQLIQLLEQIHDPRISRCRVYSLKTILFTALCAILSGYDTFVAIEVFAKEKRNWLAQYVPFPSCPSHDTFRRIFLYVNHVDLQKSLIKWLESLPNLQQQSAILRQISIDGKVACASTDQNTRATYLQDLPIITYK